MLKIGSHLSISKGFCDAYGYARLINANTFQFFSRNPRGGSMKKLDLDDINKFIELSKTNFYTPLCHAPYTLNPCSKDENTREFALKCFKEDLDMLSNFPVSLYNFHPGSHVGLGVETAIDLIADVLNKSLYENMKTTVLLETMSGKGTEVGKTFDELKQIIDKVELKEYIGVCLDTCHVYSAGFDIVNDLDKVLEEFDKLVGLDKLKAIHLNDSLMPFNSNKDRHAKIGEGSIGSKTIINIINHPKLKHLPFYLETPNEVLDYKIEIDMLKANYLG